MTNQDERLSRLSQILPWLFYRGERPGLLGKAESLAGAASGLPAKIVLTDDGWHLLSSEGEETVSEPKEVLDWIIRVGFDGDKAVVRPRIAPLLFQGAVENAERSVTEYQAGLTILLRQMPEARELFKDKTEYERHLYKPIPAALEQIETDVLLDRTQRHAIAGVALAISAAEAQVNSWGNDHKTWSEKAERKFSLVKKCVRLSKDGEQALDPGKEPLSRLQDSINLRNDLMHSKPTEKLLPLGAGAPQPGRWLSVEARKACWWVRVSIVATAASLKEEPPRYLAYCPPGEPDDDEIWRNATSMTGLREDEDFPPTESGSASVLPGSGPSSLQS